MALLGFDGQTLTSLFPNALDTENTIGAGETLTLPRPNWTITAGGPPGSDTLLVLVAEARATSARCAGAGPARSCSRSPTRRGGPGCGGCSARTCARGQRVRTALVPTPSARPC